MTYTLLYTVLLAVILLLRQYSRKEKGTVKTKWSGRRRLPSPGRLLHFFSKPKIADL